MAETTLNELDQAEVALLKKYVQTPIDMERGFLGDSPYQTLTNIAEVLHTLDDALHGAD